MSRTYVHLPSRFVEDRPATQLYRHVSPGKALGVLRRKWEGGTRRSVNVACARLCGYPLVQIDEHEPAPSLHRHRALWDVG